MHLPYIFSLLQAPRYCQSLYIIIIIIIIILFSHISLHKNLQWSVSRCGPVEDLYAGMPFII
jgi:hypothetical protein